MAWKGDSRRHSLSRKGIKTSNIKNIPCSRHILKQIEIGTKVEMEHTDDPRIAREIALNHIEENHNYYTILLEAFPDEHPELLVELKSAGIKKISVTYRENEFQTGKPVTIEYIRNPSIDHDAWGGERFQEHLDPAGKYMNIYDGFVPEGWESGTITFNNPLVIAFNSEGLFQYDENSWKAELVEEFKGKKNLALSRALVKKGYDAIITFDINNEGELIDSSEIVSLKEIT